MAAERDFELLDDYLSNRLRGQEKTAFEQKLKGDLELKAEYQLQQKLVEGIKSARIAELKTMLNNTPVPSVGSDTALFTKVAAGFVIAGLIGAGVYMFTQQNDDAATANEKPTVNQPVATAPVQEETITEETSPAEDKKTSQAETRREKREQKKALRRASETTVMAKEEEKVAEKRKLEVFDPTRENDGNTSQNNAIVNSGSPAETSSIAVETDNTNKKYTFHYQFKKDKLVLYGSFEKNLYEILEFFSDDKQRTAFLYYKESYYLLNDENEKIKPLTAVSDTVLIKKLKESRGN